MTASARRGSVGWAPLGDRPSTRHRGGRANGQHVGVGQKVGWKGRPVFGQGLQWVETTEVILPTWLTKYRFVVRGCRGIGPIVHTIHLPRFASSPPNRRDGFLSLKMSLNEGMKNVHFYPKFRFLVQTNSNLR